MKKSILSYISILIFLLMLAGSATTFAGAFNGLQLWLFTVVPSLLPYMIISSFLTESGTFAYLSRLLKPVTKYIFRLSPNCGYVIFLGFLCGYPIGSKLSADMVRKGQISRAEGQILLSFCNNVSPAFLTVYLVENVLHITQKKMLLLFLMMGTPLLCGILISRCYRLLHPSFDEWRTLPEPDFHGNVSIDSCITGSFENIFKLGGYIILFSILGEFIIRTDALSGHFQCQLNTLLEITSGLNLYARSSLPASVRLIECPALTAFGGFCCLAQTASMIRGSGLSLPLYLLAKIFIAAVTLFFSYIFLF
jgi:sporulation integral membrane protein YlbJ